MAAGELPGVDLARLRGYLEPRGMALAGDLTGEVVAGGRSNLTYIVTDGAQRWVLRRPPLGHVLATAHDMAREHRVMSALADTAVPVPRMRLLCKDDDVLGAPFYLMEHVAGTPYRAAAQLRPLGPQRTATIARGLVETLVELHRVDPDVVGLSDFGRPDGYLERQVRRWRQQLDASRSREVAGIDGLHARLASSVPVSPAVTIVHGDYRQDNLLVDDYDRVAAVLDWEMATLGDPLTDLGLMVVYTSPVVSQHAAGLVADVGLAEGYPAPTELVQQYASLSGRDASGLDWYVAFSFFKLAIILEGIHVRWTQGKTVGAGFDRIGTVVQPLVDAGTAVLDHGTERTV